jgi:hypothetical protein
MALNLDQVRRVLFTLVNRPLLFRGSAPMLNGGSQHSAHKNNRANDESA